MMLILKENRSTVSQSREVLKWYLRKHCNGNETAVRHSKQQPPKPSLFPSTFRALNTCHFTGVRIALELVSGNMSVGRNVSLAFIVWSARLQSSGHVNRRPFLVDQRNGPAVPTKLRSNRRCWRRSQLRLNFRGFKRSVYIPSTVSTYPGCCPRAERSSLLKMKAASILPRRDNYSYFYSTMSFPPSLLLLFLRVYPRAILIRWGEVSKWQAKALEFLSDVFTNIYDGHVIVYLKLTDEILSKNMHPSRMDFVESKSPPSVSSKSRFILSRVSTYRNFLVCNRVVIPMDREKVFTEISNSFSI